MAPRSWSVVLILRHIQCLYLMNSEVAWVLVSLETQVQSQIILNLDYPSDYLSVSYDYALFYKNNFKIFFFFSTYVLNMS